MNSNKFLYRKACDKNPLLLFIHGAGCDYTFWSNLNRYFYYKDFSTLAISLPGHGKNNQKPLKSVDEMANFLVSKLKKYKHKKIIPIGHSLGGLVSLAVGAKRNIGIEKIILIGTSYPMKVSDFLLLECKNDQSVGVHHIINWGLSHAVKLNGGCLTGINIANSVYNLMSKSQDGIVLKDLNACKNFRIREDIIDKIDMPVLIISGDKDIMTPKKYSIALKKMLPNARVEILRECGHFHTFEKPNEVRDLIIKYLGYGKEEK